MKSFLVHSLLLCSMFLFAGCESPEMEGIQSARLAMRNSIQQEAPGDYFIGRRYYKKDYKFWGYIRQPGQPWTTAKLVMMNEQQKLAPDRAVNQLGSDNNYEYKLYGKYSGDTVYEPASNGFYPEFVLTGYELISVSPAPIFHTPAATDPERRVIGQPY
jgi:hypothetical protein